ncbi:hypothetical protein BJ875DRAFT_458961 [Amylocarpus encephaloides]|uniref:RRM domain-containing protein n=1 Tax=Amylocarpus encephaloides TaxID=45428 RepID=A0A9P7YKJ7_9HELO|nr:hypothetical protein BJ875DRAFT_458961 [Amylocarpus encephaloides]
MATGTVTIDKVYFETLLRRAQFHTSGADFTTPLHIATVTIPKANHDNLLLTARQYDNLKCNLFKGGILEETLAVLIRDDLPAAGSGDANIAQVEEDSPGRSYRNDQSPMKAQTNGTQDLTFRRNANYAPRNADAHHNSNGINCFQTKDDLSYFPDGAEGFNDEGSRNNVSPSRPQRQQFDKLAKRTVQLGNLHESTTHADIVEVVRGGMLLDIYLRTHDRTASVSFLEEAHAQEFFRHAKRHDLYIRGKRVEMRWNDRQFILPGHVANKVAIGATRNLVILQRNPRHTEEMIRDDLEHIHNLVVIKVSFSDQNLHISTNSVHNAMFARTCMMSRSTYKGSKIKWDDDECAAPLERPQQHFKENLSPKKKKEVSLNRFQVLNMDEDGSEEDDDLDISGITIPTGISAGILA